MVGKSLCDVSCCVTKRITDFGGFVLTFVWLNLGELSRGIWQRRVEGIWHRIKVLIACLVLTIVFIFSSSPTVRLVAGSI